MKKLFLPAALLMSRLRFSYKFALSGVLALGLLMWLGASAVNQLQHRVRSIESERAGVALMNDMVEWNKVLIENRRIVITTAPGDASVRERLKQQAAVVEKTLARIEADVARFKPMFDMSADIKAVREGWVDLQKKIEALPLDAEFAQKAGFLAHAPEYDRNYAFMRDIGNRSGAALDPDLDLFYLGYPLANHTGKAAGIVVRLAAYSTAHVARGEITPKDRIYYEVNAARLDDAIAGVETMLKQSMQANPAVERKLAKSFEELHNTVKAQIAFLRKHFIDAPAITVTQQQVQLAQQAAIDASWAVTENNAAAMLEVLKERGEAAALKRNVLLAALAGGILLSVYLFVGMYLGIAQGVRRVTSAAQAIARGELGSVPASLSKDELGTLLHELDRADRALCAIVSEVRVATETIRNGSDEIARGNADLSQRTEEQASSLEETAASMEELTSTVKQNADNAAQANRLAAAASEVAVQGGTVVGEVVQTMASINESSKKIADIIGVIDGIAFQTNILALNAAVEAARAGEQGRGFAVVASEVRTLAQRSAAAAKEIKTLISDSVAKVDDGTRLVGNAGRTMDEIVSSVQRVTDIMADITSASHEQSSGIGQVNQAIAQMDQATQQNAALVEEAAAAAESMRDQAQKLGDAVAAFKLASAAEAADEAPAAFVERRGADRAQNVTRIFVKARVEPKIASNASKKTGTGDWSEF